MPLPPMILSTEGIVLKAIPFRDYDHILILFTLEAGLIKLIINGSRSKRRGIQGLCVPLTRVEVSYREKRGEIFSCHEISCLDSLSSLREELRHLEVACDLLHALLDSQCVGKPSPLLYQLLYLLLKYIPEATHPFALASSFRLKILKHDGMTSFPFLCSECGQYLETEAFVGGGEARCRDHCRREGVIWNAFELEACYRLAESRSFEEICRESLPPNFQPKVIHFFDACLKNQ